MTTTPVYCFLLHPSRCTSCSDGGQTAVDICRFESPLCLRLTRFETGLNVADPPPERTNGGGADRARDQRAKLAVQILAVACMSAIKTLVVEEKPEEKHVRHLSFVAKWSKFKTLWFHPLKSTFSSLRLGLK